MRRRAAFIDRDGVINEDREYVYQVADFHFLPGAIDADQKNNALVMEAVGGGWIAEQATLTPQSLATRLTSLLSDPATLQTAASAAKSLGQPDAVVKLADVAERLAQKGQNS